jgi:hypothetical protein
MGEGLGSSQKSDGISVIAENKLIESFEARL